jgi:hypothetical protein
MSYNFDQDQADSFEFVIGGHSYSFQYPTLEEIRELTALKKSDGQPDEQAMEDRLWQYIKPVDEGSPTAQEAVGKLKGNSLKMWRRMVNDEVFALQA